MNRRIFGKELQGHRRFGSVQAFSLVEVVLALGVVSFCLLSLSALISVGLNGNRASHEQVLALGLCRAIEADLKSTGPTNSTSPLYGIAIPATGAVNTITLYDSYTSSSNSFGASSSSGSQYRFTITLSGPSTSFPNDPVNAGIQATWPPSIVPKAPSSTSNPTNVVGTVNLNVAINRSGS